MLVHHPEQSDQPDLGTLMRDRRMSLGEFTKNIPAAVNMNADHVLDIARESIFVMIKIGAPVMVVALVVGIVIALIQALTQMQEMTLSFVPKILAIFITILLSLPFMMNTLTGYGESLFRQIALLG